MLTSYNGKTITYDAIGNPLSDGTWSYTWQAGRQLKKMTKSGMTVEFQYDHNGLRTQKKVTQNGVTTTTNYTLHGKMVTHMTVGSDKLHFFYDAQSRPAKVNHNGTIYTYLHNLQGDIVGIVDNSGNLVVEYKYDAWGKLLSTAGTKATTLGKLNPFRYRGYVYDIESNLYYLRNRYYNPEHNRFINADILLGKSNILLGQNQMAYCHNMPIMLADHTGCYADLHFIDGGTPSTFTSYSSNCDTWSVGYDSNQVNKLVQDTKIYTCKIRDSILIILNAFEGYAGIGTGIGKEFTVLGHKFGAILKWDALAAKVSRSNGIETGVLFEIGVTVQPECVSQVQNGVENIKEYLPLDIGYSYSAWYSDKSKTVEESYGLTSNITIIGYSSYSGIGVSCSISFNLLAFEEGMEAIW